MYPTRLELIFRVAGNLELDTHRKVHDYLRAVGISVADAGPMCLEVDACREMVRALARREGQ